MNWEENVSFKAYETGGYAEVDHSRVRSGLTRGGSGSMWDFNKRLGQDQKTLIQELEDESDMKDALSLSCAWLCNRDQFLCRNSCTCISLEARCDGQVIIQLTPWRKKFHIFFFFTNSSFELSAK